jgi:NitT/TauT family transport system permease protein
MSTALQVAGILALLSLWAGICASNLVGPRILPSPLAVIQTIPDLHFNDAMVRNLLYSCFLNLMGYLEAIAFCLPLGFTIGMFPLPHGMFSKPVDSIRYLPLTALTGLFMVWFGIENTMKIQFLAFGISVYLLPVVVQRVREVPQLYQQTSFTLGASKWQMFTTVFLPHVRSKIVLDIQVLVAISWTYIIVAEMMNNTGGIGGLLYSSARTGRTDKTFALLAVIILVGYVQDKIFLGLDMLINKHKYS